MNWMKNFLLCALLSTAAGFAMDVAADQGFEEYYDSPDYWDKQLFGWKSELLIDTDHGLIFDAPVVRCCDSAYIFCRNVAGDFQWEFPIGFPGIFICWTTFEGKLIALFADCETKENVLFCIDSMTGQQLWMQRMPHYDSGAAA